MPRSRAVRHVEPDEGERVQAVDVAAFVAKHRGLHLTAQDGSSMPLTGELSSVLSIAATAFEKGHGVDVIDAGADTLTPAEAAELIGVSRPTLLKLIDDGTLPAENVPGSTHRRLPRGSVEEFRDRRISVQAALSEAADEARASGLFERPRARRRRT